MEADVKPFSGYFTVIMERRPMVSGVWCISALYMYVAAFVA